MHKLKIFTIIATSLLLLCFTLFISGCANDGESFHNFAKSLEERRDSGWPIPENMNDLVGVYKYSLVSEEVQKMGLSTITDISDCEAVMEFYQNGNGRIALYDERSKGPHPSSEAYDLEWYAKKIDPKEVKMDISQDYSDFYMVQIAFYDGFNIGFEGEYLFMKNEKSPYVYKYGIAQYNNAEDWLITINKNSDTDENLIISSIKLK